MPLTPPADAGSRHTVSTTSCFNRVFALKAHRLKYVDGVAIGFTRSSCPRGHSRALHLLSSRRTKRVVGFAG